ncbi:hypothetical protein J2T05_000608 [Cupriavidus necator]|nr:hypothetical protein [Cupriavidus necator]
MPCAARAMQQWPVHPACPFVPWQEESFRGHGVVLFAALGVLKRRRRFAGVCEPPSVPALLPAGSMRLYDFLTCIVEAACADRANATAGLLLHAPWRRPPDIHLPWLARWLAEIVLMPRRQLLLAFPRGICRRHLRYIRPFIRPWNLMFHDASWLQSTTHPIYATAMPTRYIQARHGFVPAPARCVPGPRDRHGAPRPWGNLGAQICQSL